MATVTRIEFIDDIDGKPLDVEDVNVVAWSWLGVDYEFETSTANLDRIEVGRVPLANLLAKSRRIGGRRRSHGPNNRHPQTSESASTIRNWARENGYEILQRGRIPADIVDAYKQNSPAHRQK